MTTLNDTERQFAEQLLLAVKNREFTVTYSESSSSTLGGKRKEPTDFNKISWLWIQ